MTSAKRWTIWTQVKATCANQTLLHLQHRNMDLKENAAKQTICIVEWRLRSSPNGSQLKFPSSTIRSMITKWKNVAAQQICLKEPVDQTGGAGSRKGSSEELMSIKGSNLINQLWPTRTQQSLSMDIYLPNPKLTCISPHFGARI